MTVRPPRVVHLQRLAPNRVTYCGRLVDRRWLTDDEAAMTCGLCRRSLRTTARYVQGSML